MIQEGPAVLGYERFREQEERSTFGSVVDIVRSVIGAGEWELDEGMLQTFARIFFGAMSSAGESVATADDPELAAWRVEAAIGFMITGFQTLADSGYDLRARPAASPTGRGRDSSAAYFLVNVTSPPSTGISSIQVWPAGTVSSPALVDR